jgi:anti-anti-sigma regulatory factor
MKFNLDQIKIIQNPYYISILGGGEMTTLQTEVAPLKKTGQALVTRFEYDQEESLITIHVGEILDGYATEVFTKAIEQAQHDVRNHIIVDLADTARILESGLKLLTMLDERCWRMAGKIHVINCKPDLAPKVRRGLAPDVFNLSDDCKQLESHH